jgi:hypothetical protein
MSHGAETQARAPRLLVARAQAGARLHDDLRQHLRVHLLRPLPQGARVGQPSGEQPVGVVANKHGEASVMTTSEAAPYVWKVGDKPNYWSPLGPLPAEVLKVYPNGRMTLRVHQGGAVPTYTAKNVKPGSLTV